MLIRPLREEEKDLYNRVVDHPLQSWEWGEFRKKTGVKVERVGFFQSGQLQRALEVSFHPIPVINQTAGYLPKGYMPDEEQLAALRQIAKPHHALFIKLEPNVAQPVDTPSGHKNISEFLQKEGAVPGRPLFTKYTYILDLTKDEEALFAQLESKTRYNVRVAYKKGVRIFENTSKEGMEQYLDLLSKTTERQQFYAHGPEYFRTMWDTLGDSGMLKIFHAVYEEKILVSWIMFMFNGVLYYPYGASSRDNPEVMASNLMMWEMIRFGKEQGCRSFDMWGSLGPDADKSNPWYGFHRFKRGYNGTLYEFLGTYDLITGHKQVYNLFRVIEDIRWKLLRLRAKLPF
ncbi:MAG TPA: peptidoglycan bridge formation glycyltransferase FemA/FemB family protein [Patescibacteria group bacterium]